MPIASVRLVPGLNIEKTPTLNEAGYSVASLGRFRDGLFQKIGGWSKFYSLPVSGIPRALHAWQDLNNAQHLAVGSTTRLGAVTAGVLTDITPQTLTTDFPPKFTTTAGSPLVLVNDPNINTVTTFDSVLFNTPIAIDGLVLSGTYPIAVVTGTTSYKITASSNAVAGVTNGGAVPAFTTGAGSAVVNVKIAAHGRAVGDTVVFPLASSDGNDQFTKLLLHCDGANASTSFPDSNAGSTPHTVTAHGNAQVSTAQKEFGTGSAAFDGTAGTNLTLGGGADFAFGTGDFTIDFWFRLNAVGALQFMFDGRDDLASHPIPSIYVDTTNKLEYLVNGANQIAGTTTLAAGAWHHLAVARAGTSTKLFLDGTQEGSTYTDSNTYTVGAGVPFVGASGLGAAPFTGWIDELRISKGIARWTANFTPPTAFYGGNTLAAGAYTVASIVDVDNFTITNTMQAASAVTFSMNGGDAEIVYYINLGPTPAGAGYGLGGYGLGGYGTGLVPASQTGAPIATDDYTLDNWGQLFVGCPKNGGIYVWDPTGGFTNAALIAAAPIFCAGIFVAMPQQQIVAYGASTAVGIGVEQDPLLVRWCDVSNFNQWIAAGADAANFAGQYRIPTGSALIGGLQASQYGLLWTDLDLWTMTWLGYPDVFGFNKIGADCGLVGPHARTQLGGVVYWMTRSSFFSTAGGVAPIACPVWDAVFQDLDTANLRKCQAVANTPFNEVFFFYPSASGGTGECDKYAKFNTVQNTWDTGPLPRSAGISQSVLGAPIMASPQSIIYQHETGFDADGGPINAVMETGYFMIAEGHDMATVDLIWPDFKFGPFGGSQAAQIQITVKMVDYPGDTPRVFGPYTVGQATQYVNTRARGRAMALRVESSDIGSFWRIGNVRFRYQPDGRR